MDLSPKTKVNDLLNHYPFLKDFLIQLNPEFKMLDNPFVRKTVGKLATLGKAAMISGIDVKKLLDDIAGEIKEEDRRVLRSRTVSRARTNRMRIDTMKNIIKDLHAGKDAESQKKKFGELIKDVAPWEIAQMEQRLIAEGMPETEIKSLCDVHVKVFPGIARAPDRARPAGRPPGAYADARKPGLRGHSERSGGDQGFCEGEGQAARHP